MKIKNAIDIYTGGNIYIFVGELENGDKFLADGDLFDVRILDAATDYLDADLIFDVEYQEEHLVNDLDTEKEGPQFIVSVIDYLREHNDYFDSYLDAVQNDARSYIGKTNWR